MRLTEFLCKRSNRLPMDRSMMDKVKFRELLPLQLNNTVSGKSQKGADVSCLQEMAVMFACMKKHDFREVKCTDEINIFNKCYTEHTQTKKLQKQREESGEFIAGSNVRNLTTKQLNELLQKYPQHNKKL